MSIDTNIALKKLIFVRHGLYRSSDLHLSQGGIYQIEVLSGRLSQLVLMETIAILSSPADRAKESADIIGRRLGVEVETHEDLWSDSDHPENFERAVELIKPYLEKVDSLIIVTHLEYVDELPWYFARKHLNFRLNQDIAECSKGCAYVLTYVTPGSDVTISLITPN